MYSSFTSESVAAGHPDKICDQISDSILDEALKKDINSRVAVETAVTKNRVIIIGEVTSKADLNYEEIARRKIAELGYKKEFGFYDGSEIDVFVQKQSKDIALGVDNGGAGDQGMMFGYATKETKELMPLPIILAHRLVEKMDLAREKGEISYLRPDGKSEVKVCYENNLPKKVEKVVLAVPFAPEVEKKKLREDLLKKIVWPVLKRYEMNKSGFDFIVNGTGKWEIGGPSSDSGMTGRKIMVDSYGGMGRHGGGCFSGKDPTKVDRSGAYAARFLAKNLVANNYCQRCEVQMAYVIGYKEPISLEVETFGTEKKGLEEIKKYCRGLIDLSVRGIIRELKLLKAIYSKTARYGHFGREEFGWEKVVN